MGYPTAVGVLWHVTDRVAIRPEIDFSRQSVSSAGNTPLGPLTEESTTTVIRPGLSALFYLTRQEDLRLYISPRVAYTATESSESVAGSTSTYLVSGSFGAQHRLGSRFAVFGELGVEYSRSRFDLSALSLFATTTRRSSITTRSGAGIVLYF